MKNHFHNIVLIDTYNSSGTGIILPCRYDKSDDKDYSYYIVITNYHVLHSREDIEEPVREISDRDIHLMIFDKDRKLVSDEDYKIIDIETAYPVSEEEDIAAVLVKIRKAYEMEGCCQAGSLREMEERADLYTKGFPGILQEEAEAMPVSFTGKLQLNYYKGGKMGTYRMQENFHYYADYGDEDVFSGLSGGPVFIRQDEEIRLVGMNQGVFANNDGDSPYQLVRFLEISYILEYLRQNRCILYSLLYGNISIIWIRDENQNKAKEYKQSQEKEAVCILGGSGAGKSSFVESLTQHAHILETVGDGQTTRTDIYYYLSLSNNNPAVKVFFLEKEQFAQKMYQTVFPDLLALIFEYELGFRKIDIRVEPYLFLRANLEYLQAVLEQKKPYQINEEKYTCIKNACESAKENEDMEELCLCYTYFCNIIYECMHDYGISRWQIIRIFDISVREKIIKRLISLNDQKIDTDIHNIEGIDFERFYLEGIKEIQMPTAELVKNLHILPCEAKKLYVEAVLEMGKSDENGIHQDDRLLEELCTALTEQKGIFSCREVSYLFEEEAQRGTDFTRDSKRMFGILENSSFIEDIKQAFFQEDRKDNRNKIVILYEKLYDQVMEKIKEKKAVLQHGVSLTCMTKEEKQLINLCVRSRQTKSLSAFVDCIEVWDSYFYEYAIPIYESGQNEMLLIDTCGLDHIDKGKGNRFTLSGRVAHIKRRLADNYQNQYQLNNIIYLKKLDAGKPTEISDIFAYIADMDLEGGLYCVFTGLDIYESSNGSFFAQNKNWHMDNSLDGYPKVMQYLIDRQNKEELLRMCNCVSYRKEDLYRVMSQNVITYCANRKLCEKQGKYQENNIAGIRSLFESIFQKETELLQLSVKNGEEIEKYEKVLSKNGNEIKKELKKLITLMFDLASVTKWARYYWQTLNANLNRYIKGEKGFARLHDHTWMHLFSEGYRLTFEKESAEDFYRLFEEYERRTFSLVRQMRIEYIIRIISDDKYLKKIYDECCKDGHKEIINAYNEEEIKRYKDNASPNTYAYAEVLAKITNFGLIIRTCPEEKGVDALVELFMDRLNVKNEETAKSEMKFFETRVDIRNKTDELIKVIRSYGFQDEAVKALFCRRVDEKKQF